MPASTASICVTSCAFAPVTTSDNGTPRPSTSRWRLLPFFPPIRRVASHGLLRQGRLEHRPVNALPAPRDALQVIVLGQSRLPQILEESGLGPLHELLVHGAGAAKAFSRQGLPLAAGPEHVHDGLEHQARRLGRTAPARAAQVLFVGIACGLRYQWLHAFPELIRHFPRIGMGFGYPLLLRRVPTGSETSFKLFTDKSLVAGL